VARNIVLSFMLILLVSSCSSVPINIKELTPESDIATKLPIATSAMVYVSTPYAEKHANAPSDISDSSKRTFIRKLISAKLIESTDIKIAKKYFTNASRFYADKKANYFIFFSGYLIADPLQAVATVHGRIYNEKGEKIYDASAQSGEVTGGKYNKASFTNAIIKAQMQFYNDLFSSSAKSLHLASVGKPVLARSIVNKLDKHRLRDIYTATGFVINRDGDTLTNYHAVKNCLDVGVHLNNTNSHANIRYTDTKEDLALLSSNLRLKTYARFAGTGMQPRLGDDIVVLGFPLQGVLSSDPSLSTGNISAMAGIKNNESVYQITAPVQQGNSGGPVLNKSGAVIAIVQSKLNAVRIANYTGDIPQNVNFAIKNKVVKKFLQNHHIKYAMMNKFKKLSTPDIAEIGSAYTVEVTCKGYVDLL
jgi:S1-C subfamily serine protease